MLLHRPQLLQMVDRALKDQAPVLRASLLQTGQLPRFLGEKADEIESTHAAAFSRLLDQTKARSILDYWSKVQRLNELDSHATEIALAEALEFPPEEGDEGEGDSEPR